MEQTLEDYLTQANSAVLFNPQEAAHKLDKSRGLGNTRTLGDDAPRVKAIQKWKDFSRENLEKCFRGELGNVLRRRYRGLSSFSHASSEFRHVSSEPSLRALITSTLHPVILEALEKTSCDLLQQDIRMTTGDNAKLLDNKTNKEPDFAGIKHIETGGHRPKPDNILPGDAKPSWVWNSEALHAVEKLKNPDAVEAKLEKNKGLLQVVDYCLRASVRYGYIITDAELFIFRVRHNDGTASKPADNAELCNITRENAVLDYQSVPWSWYGNRQGKLTIKMTLWALHLLAANDGHLKFEYDKCLEDEVIIDRAKRRTPPTSAPSVTQSSFEFGDFPDLDLPGGSIDDDVSEEEQEQDVPTGSQNTSFNIPGPSTPLSKRKRDAEGEGDDDETILVAHRRNTRSTQGGNNHPGASATTKANSSEERASHGDDTGARLRERSRQRNRARLIGRYA